MWIITYGFCVKVFAHLLPKLRWAAELEVDVGSISEQHDAAGDSGQRELRLVHVKLRASGVQSGRQQYTHDGHQQQARVQMSRPLHTDRHELSDLSIYIYTSKLVGSRYANLYLGRTGGWLQMNRLSSRNNWLKFKTSGDLPIVLEESIEYTSNEWKQNRKMSTCDRLDLESLGS